MKKELEDKIFKRFKNFFPGGRKVSPMQNLMCFGFCHGDGWFDIIWNALENIEEYLYMNTLFPALLKFVQIKEKFGTLNMYYETKDTTEEDEKMIRSIISIAENASASTCEICGDPGKLFTSGWHSTLCKECNKE